MSKRENER